VDERTEDAALSRVLHLSIGGEAVTLRTLSLDESDIWLHRLGASIAAIDVPDDITWLGDIGALLTASAESVRGLVKAYDLDGALPADWQERMTKRELKAALEVMVTAEDPFGTDVARSVAVGFGAPSQALQFGMRQVALVSQLARSTAGLSASAPTTDASGESGAASSSSSDGRTGTTTPVRSKRHG
jgi:hypothetical protein